MMLRRCASVPAQNELKGKSNKIKMIEQKTFRLANELKHFPALLIFCSAIDYDRCELK